MQTRVGKGGCVQVLDVKTAATPSGPLRLLRRAPALELNGKAENISQMQHQCDARFVNVYFNAQQQTKSNHKKEIANTHNVLIACSVSIRYPILIQHIPNEQAHNMSAQNIIPTISCPLSAASITENPA